MTLSELKKDVEIYQRRSKIAMSLLIIIIIAFVIIANKE